MVVLSVLGTSAMMYLAPGYFSDSREMDASHAAVTRADLDQRRATEGSLPALLRREAVGWLHGDLGQSRQFGTPVAELVHERALVSLKLLAASVLTGWTLALAIAVPCSLYRAPAADLALAGLTAILLALPVGVLATLCLVGSFGGPVLVLSLAVAVRDFKLLQRMLQSAWGAPHILQARAQGCSSRQILHTHIALHLQRELLSMGVLSFTLALSALVPVEVVFDVSGLGQLAWAAATNRDLPVLVAVTSLMATCVGLASMCVSPSRLMGDAQCA